MEDYDLLLRAGVRSISSGIEETTIGSTIPRSFELSNNFPNPFNSSTSFNLTVNEPGFYRFHIVDMSGRIITTLLEQSLTAGIYPVNWNGTNKHGLDVPSGIYFARLFNKSESQQAKITLVK